MNLNFSGNQGIVHSENNKDLKMRPLGDQWVTGYWFLIPPTSDSPGLLPISPRDPGLSRTAGHPLHRDSETFKAAYCIPRWQRTSVWAFTGSVISETGKEIQMKKMIVTRGNLSSRTPPPEASLSFSSSWRVWRICGASFCLQQFVVKG